MYHNVVCSHDLEQEHIQQEQTQQQPADPRPQSPGSKSLFPGSSSASRSSSGSIMSQLSRVIAGDSNSGKMGVQHDAPGLGQLVVVPGLHRIHDDGTMRCHYTGGCS